MSEKEKGLFFGCWLLQLTVTLLVTCIRSLFTLRLVLGTYLQKTQSNLLNIDMSKELFFRPDFMEAAGKAILLRDDSTRYIEFVSQRHLMNLRIARVSSVFSPLKCFLNECLALFNDAGLGVCGQEGRVAPTVPSHRQTGVSVRLR